MSASDASLDPNDAAARRRRGWNRVAKLAALAFLVGSPVYIGLAFTCGLLSGLIVLMIPLYPVALQVTLGVIGVALSLARRHFVLARALGLVIALGPATTFVLWYLRERWRCAHAADPAACFDYLDGSPLLAIAVVGYALVSIVGAGLVLVVVQSEVRSVHAAAR